MRQRGRVLLGGLSVATLLALLAADAPFAPAASRRITGRLTKPGYTVIALAASGKARTVRTRQGRFRVRPPAEVATLHLRASDGTYAGPIVLDTEGKRAILGVEPGAELGRIEVRRGYARVLRALPEEWIEETRWARARRGVPIGARVFGRVRSRPRPGVVPGDRDLDGVPGPLDIDDDGDLVLDNFEPGGGSGGSPASVRTLASGTDRRLLSSHEASQFGLSSGLNQQLHDAVNANAAALTVQDIDANLSLRGHLKISILPGDSAELDCTGLTYCSPGGTGILAFSGPEPWPEFPECCDPDGDGFGTLTEAAAFGSAFPGDFFLRHGATTDRIGTGDVLIQRVTTDGVETQYPAAVQMVLATISALVSYSDGQGNSATVSYPVAPPGPPGIGGPGTEGNGFPVRAGSDGEVSLTLTFWRPQRKPIPPERAEWIDIGGLHYIAAVGHAPELTAPYDHAVKDCPPGAYSTSDPNLTPVSLTGGTPGGPGVLGAVKDLAADRPADPANTFTYSVKLTACFETWGLSWALGQEREILFRTTNLNDDGFLHVYFKRQ